MSSENDQENPDYTKDYIYPSKVASVKTMDPVLYCLYLMVLKNNVHISRAIKMFEDINKYGGADGRSTIEALIRKDINSFYSNQNYSFNKEYCEHFCKPSEIYDFIKQYYVPPKPRRKGLWDRFVIYMKTH